jgi:hypothetical protein
MPNEAAIAHWRVPAAYNNASISNELDIGLPQKNDRYACRIASSACRTPTIFSMSKQMMCVPFRSPIS